MRVIIVAELIKFEAKNFVDKQIYNWLYAQFFTNNQAWYAYKCLLIKKNHL